MPDAFVIQEHTGCGPTHYDFMLDAGGETLSTWRLTRKPGDLADGEGAPALRLADHRRAYLTYEGRVSRGRGRVRIVDRGEYKMLSRTDGVWLIVLAGKVARGRFELRRISLEKPDEWTITRPPEGEPVNLPPQPDGSD